MLEEYLVFVAKTGNTVGFNISPYYPWFPLQLLVFNLSVFVLRNPLIWFFSNPLVQVFPWPKIKPAVRVKLESIIADFSLAMPEEQVGSNSALIGASCLVLCVVLLPFHVRGAGELGVGSCLIICGCVLAMLEQ